MQRVLRQPAGRSRKRSRVQSSGGHALIVVPAAAAPQPPEGDADADVEPGGAGQERKFSVIGFCRFLGVSRVVGSCLALVANPRAHGCHQQSAYARNCCVHSSGSPALS